MPNRHKVPAMDLRHLRTFVTVAEQGTVSRASLRLRVAQPALSRQISDLEAELGVRLFDRIRRRLVLTGEGEQLLGDCRTVLGAVGSLGERAQALRGGEAGVLKMAATPQTIDGVLANFLHHFGQRRPDVQIKLTEAVGPTLPAMLERGELHLGISLLRPVQAGNHPFEMLALPPIEFLAACHPSLALGHGGSADIRSLGAHPLLLIDTSFFVRTTFDAFCRVAGFKPNVFFESRTPHALLALAEAGHGVAIVPSVLPTHRYRLRVLRLTHRGKALREPYGIVWDRRRVLPPYAQEFCGSLATYLREAVPLSQPPARTAGRPTGRKRKEGSPIGRSGAPRDPKDRNPRRS
jgi:DNA-binding transcriptional LysR family regulator